MKIFSKISHLELGLGLSLVVVAGSWLLVNFLYFDKPSKPDAGVIAQTEELIKQGQKNQAIDLILDELEKDPDNQSLKYKLAEYYYLNANYEQFFKYIQDQQLNSSPINNYAASYYLSLGNTEKAIEYYQINIKNSPSSSNSYVNIAAVYQSLGDYNQAIATLQQGLEKNPKSVKLNLSVASLYYKIKNYQLARVSAERVLEVEKNNSQAKKILESL